MKSLLTTPSANSAEPVRRQLLEGARELFTSDKKTKEKELYYTPIYRDTGRLRSYVIGMDELLGITA